MSRIKLTNYTDKREKRKNLRRSKRYFNASFEPRLLPNHSNVNENKVIFDVYKNVFGEKFMAISSELLEILRCPKCKSKVELKTDASGLRCVNAECALVYPIRDEIPVMLIEEATKEK